MSTGPRPILAVRCPKLAELPPSPPGKSGWPWTVETPPLAPARPDRSPWPRISIVTPSYNQGQFIEETIRSVLLQGYPELEYIIIDGGSTDQSVEIIKKYAPWLTYWVSEKDRGQAHAINKGLSISTGEIFQWINSDDVLLPNCMCEIAKAYSGHAVGASLLVGYNIDGAQVGQNENLRIEVFLNGAPGFNQQALWWPRRKVDLVGIDERYNCAFDWDLVIRYLDKFPEIVYIRPSVVFFRLHGSSKTVRQAEVFEKEKHAMRARLSYSLSDPRHRSICREAQHRNNWERRLTEWRQNASIAKRDIAIRMVLLALRNPRLRISRFWFGAFWRTVLSAR